MRRVAVGSGLLLLLVSAQAGPAPDTSERFVPDTVGEATMTLDGRTWSSSNGSVDMRLQRLSDDERTAYIEHVTGARIDPFRSRGGEAAGFETFLVEVRNGGDDGVSFNPRDCWLSAGRHGVLQPLGMEDLGALYRQLEGDLPEAYNRVRPALLDQVATIEGGQRVAGLLVYQGLEAGAKRYSVDLKVVLPTGDVVRTSAPYRRAE